MSSERKGEKEALPEFTAVLGSFFASLTQARVIPEEGTSTEKVFLTDWLIGEPVRHFLD